MKKIFNFIYKKYLSFLLILFQNNSEKYLKIQYLKVMESKLDLNNPKSFNEKVQWFKLNVRNNLVVQCTDKIAVRDYISKKGYSDLLVKLYGTYENPKDINFKQLPNNFVIKTNNGCGDVIIIKDISEIDIPKLIKQMNKSLKFKLYKKSKEWQYKYIKPKILIEETIKSSKPIYDYKFFCFNGKCHVIYVSTTKIGDDNYNIDFYDTNWNYLNVRRIGHKNLGKIEKPKNFNKMLKIAEDLSKEFPHVRVDLYNVEGHIYFGELTFTSGSGYNKYTNMNFDEYLGTLYDVELWNREQK